MPTTRDLKDSTEDVLLLYPGSYREKFNSFAEPSIPKGVIHQLKKWPSDLFSVFLSACLVAGSLIFLIVITMALCLPAITDNRIIKNIEIEQSPNVYFFKLENHSWSTREFCYIETAARKHPDLNVYLINLLKEEPPGRDLTERIESEMNFKKTSSNARTLTPEKQLKNRLVSGSTNIRSIDVSIEKFFKNSKLSKIAKNLTDEILQVAAKAQLLWNSPGIVLNPNMYCNLESIEQFLCKYVDSNFYEIVHSVKLKIEYSLSRKKENCVSDNLATIELKNDIQAAEVPCQAFLGFVVQEISKNTLLERFTLKEAVEEYCPRLYYCPEIRILNLNSKCPSDELNCPIVYSSIILQDGLNVETFLM